MIYLKISTVCLSIVLVVGQSNYPPNNYNPQNNYDSQTYNPNYPQNSNNNNYNPQNNNYNPQSSFPQSNYNPNNPNNQNNYNNPNNQNNYNNPNNPNYNQNNYNQNNYNNPQIDQGDCCEEYCYSDDPEPYSQFGTKTSYDSLTRRGGNQHVIPDCKPVQFWSIVRHGTNLPDQETIRMMREKSRLHEDIIRNHEQRRSWPDKGRLCAKDYDLFKRWRFNESISERNANSLTKQGSDDMKLIARRYKTRFSELLQNYDERTYNFQYTPENHDSFQAYIEGLFENDAFRVHANTINGDRLTRPTQFCPRWQELESSQFITASEIQRFKDKPEYQKMVKDVFRRLGYRFAPNATVIEEIYNLCRYEKAWNPLPKSAWCIAFNQNQLKVLEYAEDLKYYYESGYGNKLADRIGCNPVKDMYERFERTVNGNPDGTKASFLFSNTDTFISTLVSLGIAKEGPLLNSENYYQQTRRDWRTSVLSPFAANLVATLYECNRDEKYRVMFFLNENPVEFRECSVGLCNWSAVQQKYQETVRDCDINNFCKKGGAAKNFAASAVFLLTSLLIFKL